MRLRLGISMWLLSWVPYGVILGLSGAWLTAAWTFEILLGLAGLAVAGAEFAEAVKEGGWRRAPAVAWRAIVHGQKIGDAESAVALEASDDAG
jgi:hypothetical protein